MSGEYEIRTLPLSLKMSRRRVEEFLSGCGLRLDAVDYYAVVTRIDDDRILAGGGLSGNVIKCVAVSDEQRGTGMMQSLISHLLSTAREHGHEQVRVFTKPGNQSIFESLGFKLIATAPQAIFMENALRGIGEYCKYLSDLRRPGKNGMIVMNANPFTLGHLALVEYGASLVHTLYVIVVREDCSHFSYRARMAMIKAGTRHLRNVVVCEGSDYAISATTFPTYFLKQLSDASDTQIMLDLDICCRHLAPALGATMRIVGSEPTDALTARYVELMQSKLPLHGIEVTVLDRVTQEGAVVSASSVRKCLQEGDFRNASRMVPETTVPYLLGDLARRALQVELDTTPKPGLVDCADNGAHRDMDYATMQRSIESLRRAFDTLALWGQTRQHMDGEPIQQLGIDAERDMLRATGGVNTHRGALFAMGIAVLAVSNTWHKSRELKPGAIRQAIMKIAHTLRPAGHESHGSAAVTRYHVDGAMGMARHGYQRLFSDWLPFYGSLSGDTWQCHKTLLRIMATLDDTNVIHRVGYDMAQQVKAQAGELLDDFTAAGLEAMNRRFIEQNISPGGAADMLSLTIFLDSVSN